jgi:cob(I)alamin adenosyltransferase
MTIYVYTGDGAGKTTSALGLAMRSIGHGQKVVMIQFMKWWKKTGEYKIQKKLADFYEVYQFGRAAWLKLAKKAEPPKFGSEKFKVEEVESDDRAYALEGLKKAEEIILKKKPSLLILDEACLAVASGLLQAKEVLDVVERAPKEMSIVLTGRNAPKEIIDAADFVNRIEAVKYPQDAKVKKGVQY